MPEKLNVVALISGGKDSLYSILHCQQNGHNLVALANLHPPTSAHVANEALSSQGEEEKEKEEDMNSYMYQTVGHQVIPYYSEALGLPLLRRAITGVASQTDRYYNSSYAANIERDEIEDLYRLLQDVLEIYPEVNAVSSGAILSTYQRTRVESVATRLGLTSLAYLWQYPALPPPKERNESVTGLLDDMASAGCDSRIIKVASGGIKESMLWTNVTDLRNRTRLVAGLKPFFEDQPFWLRGAVLGEGGEYETLAIDGPSPLWKKLLQFELGEITSLVGEGGVYYSHLGRPHLMEKLHTDEQTDFQSLVRIPVLCDPSFEAVRKQLNDQTSQLITDQVGQAATRDTSQVQSCSFLKASLSVGATHVIVSNVVAHKSGPDPAAQMKEVVSTVVSMLSTVIPSITLSSSVFSLLLLSSMADFACINPIYATLFTPGEPNPPARVTVAVDLPSEVKVSLSLIFHRSPRSQKRGLHVQSRSYWAPANIGPYSQAICEPFGIVDDMTSIHDTLLPELVHIAGQIPLVPQSMKMLEAHFADQAILSLQHLWRIGQERGVDLWSWGVAFLSSSKDTSALAGTASKIWTATHLVEMGSKDDHPSDSDEERDIWFQRHDQHTPISQKTTLSSRAQHLHRLPNPSLLPTSGSGDEIVPPFIAAEVLSLPRDAPIEWWSLGLSNVVSSSVAEGRKTITSQWGSVGVLTVWKSIDRVPSEVSESSFVSIRLNGSIKADRIPSLESILSDVTDQQDSSRLKVIYATAFCVGQQGQEVSKSLLGVIPQASVIPCRSVWGSLGSGIDGDGRVEPVIAALLLRAHRISS